MTRGVEEVGGWWRRREALVENPSERGAQWPRFQWREREEGPRKDFRGTGDSIRFRGKKKEKRKTRDDTSPRKSIFSK